MGYKKGNCTTVTCPRCGILTKVKLGKKIEKKWAPRTIDLDILLYNNIIIDLPELQIPHKLMHSRAFVLVPLAQIAPNIIHPILNKTIKDLLYELSDDSKVVLYNKKSLG